LVGLSFSVPRVVGSVLSSLLGNKVVGRILLLLVGCAGRGSTFLDIQSGCSLP
jgi:hypothetical protein